MKFKPRSEYTAHYYFPLRHCFVPAVMPVVKQIEDIAPAFKSVRDDIAIDDAVSHLNQLVRLRQGVILADGQILTTNVLRPDVLDYGIEPIEAGFSQEFQNREWTILQQMFFQISNPYQLSEEEGQYGYGWILLDSGLEFLNASERILALLHGEHDNRPFYCTCHSAQVTYTNEGRLVCMSCGILHCVLRDKLQRHFKHSLSMHEWFDYFGFDGGRKEEAVNLDIVDFIDIEHVEKIWATDQYEQSASEFVFFTRSSPQELEEYFKAYPSPEVFIEAGWTLVHQPPEPPYQLAGFTYKVDKLTNVISSLNEAVPAYDKARTQLSFLKAAILQLFHAIELILKLRLEELDSSALLQNPNNPTVIDLLREQGVVISDDELTTISELRKLRNAFQHAEPSYNYRATLLLLKQGLVFVDRFSIDELNVWIAEHVSEHVWQLLLLIPSIRSRGNEITSEIIEQIKLVNSYQIATCPRCETQALVSRPNEGSLCINCRHRPTLNELRLGD
jgi:hypothetical protein